MIIGHEQEKRGLASLSIPQEEDLLGMWPIL
jgi:hypothetical protein